MNTHAQRLPRADASRVVVVVLVVRVAGIEALENLRLDFLAAAQVERLPIRLRIPAKIVRPKSAGRWHVHVEFELAVALLERLDVLLEKEGAPCAAAL